MVGDCCCPPCGSSENGEALPPVVKTPQRRTTLQSQLSRFEDEDREKERAAGDAMSPVQVSAVFREFLGTFSLSIHHHCVALIHLLIAKKEAFWHTKKIAK